MVSYLPTPGKVGEMKTKPTQHAVRALNASGIQPDIMIARADTKLDQKRKEKLSLFTTPENAVAILNEYEKIGVTHIICMVNFGGVPMTDVRRTLELMSKEVMPKFQ